MSTEKLIDIYRKRDFGDLLQDSIKFAFSNALPLLKAILIFVGPLILLSAILGAGTLGGFAAEIAALGLNPQLLSASPLEIFPLIYSALPGLWVLIAFIIIGMSITIVWYGTYNSFFLNYGKSEGGTISIQNLKTQITEHFLPYAGLIGLRMLISLGFMIISLGLLVMMPTGFVGGLLRFAVNCFSVYIGVIISFIFIIRMNEGPDNIGAFKRAFNIIKGHWWQTFGLYLVLGIFIIFLMLLGAGILWIIAATGIISSGIGGVFYGLFAFALLIFIGYLAGTMSMTATGLQYFNLTGEEHAEDLINEMGTDAPEDSFE